VAFAPRPLSEAPCTLARINAGISYSAQRGTAVRPPFLEWRTVYRTVESARISENKGRTAPNGGHYRYAGPFKGELKQGA